MSIEPPDHARGASPASPRARSSPGAARAAPSSGRAAAGAALPTVPDTIGRAELLGYLDRAAVAMGRHAEYLNRLDAALGDGDHGENMLIGCQAVVRQAASDSRADVGELLREVGHTLVASVGGASGPLYGTAFIEAGLAVQGADWIDLPMLAAAFEAATRGLARRGRCALGDKTILDALEPAARSLRRSAEEHEPFDRSIVRAARAARAGMLATIPLIARRGLALRLGERSRGHQDPGATSCYLLVRALDPRGTAELAAGRG